MKEDISLINLNHGFCQALERNGSICFNKKYSKGICLKHYTRLRRNNSISLDIRIKKNCKFIDCNKVNYCRGFCHNHYKQYMYKNTTNICDAENCNKRTPSKYCSMHQTRLKRYGSLLGSGNKKGGYFKAGHGIKREKKYKECLAKECNKDSNECKITKGLCPKHYQRWKKTGKYDEPNNN